MFARRIAAVNDTVELPGPPPQSPSRPGNRRKAAVRVLEHVADVLLRRPHK
jgi:hypothetical protein